MISVSVDLATHGEAVDLMRALDGFHPWTVQLGPEQWVVVARAERRERVDTVTALVSQWAAEHHRGPLPCRAGEDEALVQPTNPAGPQ